MFTAEPLTVHTDERTVAMNFAQPDAGAHLDTVFIHYTTRRDAAAIIATGELRPSTTITNSVFAVAVGGALAPGVQHAKAPGGRDAAVLFRSVEPPSVWFPEEVIWRTSTPVTIQPLAVTDAAHADTLLDSSTPIPDDGWWHTNTCRCTQCETRAATMAL